MLPNACSLNLRLERITARGRGTVQSAPRAIRSTPMQLQELEERMHAFVNSKGWYDPDSAQTANAAQPGSLIGH